MSTHKRTAHAKYHRHHQLTYVNNSLIDCHQGLRHEGTRVIFHTLGRRGEGKIGGTFGDARLVRVGEGLLEQRAKGGTVMASRNNVAFDRICG